MTKFKKRKNPTRSICSPHQKGQSVVEYLVIVSLIAISTIAILRVLGQSIQTKLAKVAESLGAVSDAPIDTPIIHKSFYNKKDMSDFMEYSVDKSKTRDSNNEKKQ